MKKECNTPFPSCFEPHYESETNGNGLLAQDNVTLCSLNQTTKLAGVTFPIRL